MPRALISVATRPGPPLVPRHAIATWLGGTDSVARVPAWSKTRPGNVGLVVSCRAAAQRQRGPMSGDTL